MSRATDAFSSLISDVPGVDTSCFVKRSLNDLRGGDGQGQETNGSQKETAAIERCEERKVPAPEVVFASGDLDTLGKEATPKVAAQSTAQFEDLFEHIPGCVEPVFVPEKEEPIVEELKVEELIPTVEPQADDPVPAEKIEDVREGVDVWEEIPEELQNEDAPSAPPMLFQQEDGVGKTSDFMQKIDKYRTTLNKKAVDLRKKGMRAVRQGLDAAQEWVDKKVEERKQTNLTASQKKEETRQIEKFLADMEKLSHYRRELLMREIPAEFFQKVVDYAALKGMSVEHLFVTGSDEARTLHERQPIPDADPELQSTSDSQETDEGSTGESEECLQVTGDESQKRSEAEEDDFDLLGLSSKNESAAQTQQPNISAPFADPDDLDSFFTGGLSTTEDRGLSAGGAAHLYEDKDLMEFEGGCSSNVKSDLTKIYEQLKAAGQYTEEEIRAILKEKRHQEKQSKMAAALQAKVDREREVAETQELFHTLKEQHLQKIVVWKEKHANNMRGLLTTLQTVLWENSGWKPLCVGDVLEVSQVKKAYMKANLIIHPDKVKQKGGTAEQVVLADMVFNVLKDAWQKFQS